MENNIIHNNSAEDTNNSNYLKKFNFFDDNY